MYSIAKHVVITGRSEMEQDTWHTYWGDAEFT
jgi:hypothetical protein